ncbi:hypothetical protein ABPG75_000282 [Micractinium tetrahymenae]
MPPLEPAGPPTRPPRAQAWVQGAAAAAAELPGPTAAPFRARWLLWAERQHTRTWHQPWLNLAFSLAILFRCWYLLAPLTAAWLAGSIVLSAADVAWRESAPDSYARWREVPAVAARLLAFGPTATWVLMRAVLDDHGAPQPDSVGGASSSAAAATSVAAEAVQWAAHLARLLFASGAAKMAANALSFRTCLGPSFAVQLALLLAAGRHTRLVCSAAAFSHPAAQRRTRQLHRLFTSLAGTAVASSASPAAPCLRSPVDDCATIITWLRLALALLLPLLVEASTEARLWRSHQVQRRQAGLPPEHCGRLQLAVYRAARWLGVGWGSVGGDGGGVEDARLAGGALHAALVTWLLLAAAWEWCTCILRL